MSSIGYYDGPPDYERMREEHGRIEAAYDAEYDRLAALGLPVPENGFPQISTERLDMSTLWRSLSDTDRETIGMIGLGLVVGGAMSMHSEITSRPASRAGLATYHAALELLTEPPPEAVMAAMRGPSWRIPDMLGPVCLSCGCSEADPCEHGCGWEDARQIRCTACANPPPLDVDIPF